MKLRLGVIAVLCISLSYVLWGIGSQANAQGRAASAQPEITVLNPMGTPPPIEAKQMAPRLDTLEGKTIYFVNTGYIGTDRLMAVMTDWFKANYPKTNIVNKDNRSGAGLSSVSDALWKEMTEKADAAIVGLGH